jgi:hypothetical protein
MTTAQDGGKVNNNNSSNNSRDNRTVLQCTSQSRTKITLVRLRTVSELGLFWTLLDVWLNERTPFRLWEMSHTKRYEATFDAGSMFKWTLCCRMGSSVSLVNTGMIVWVPGILSTIWSRWLTVSFWRNAWCSSLHEFRIRHWLRVGPLQYRQCFQLWYYTV